jgi:NADH-quinone oxidoreductase subunit H
MKFGLFYAGELLHAFTFGGFWAVLFFGGWNGPGVEQMPVLGFFYFLIKALIGYWVIMWVKYTVPRIRIDHMLTFNWKFLTPLSLVVLIVTAIVHRLLLGSAPVVYTLGMLFSNLVVAWITIEILRGQSRSERKAVEAAKLAAVEPAHH